MCICFIFAFLFFHFYCFYCFYYFTCVLWTFLSEINLIDWLIMGRLFTGPAIFWYGGDISNPWLSLSWRIFHGGDFLMWHRQRAEQPRGPPGCLSADIAATRRRLQVSDWRKQVVAMSPLNERPDSTSLICRRFVVQYSIWYGLVSYNLLRICRRLSTRCEIVPLIF